MQTQVGQTPGINLPWQVAVVFAKYVSQASIMDCEWRCGSSMKRAHCCCRWPKVWLLQGDHLSETISLWKQIFLIINNLTEHLYRLYRAFYLYGHKGLFTTGWFKSQQLFWPLQFYCRQHSLDLTKILRGVYKWLWQKGLR